MNALSESLLNAKFISKEEYDSLIGESPLSVETFISSLKYILTKEQYKIVIDYLYQIAANPYSSRTLFPQTPHVPYICVSV